MKAPRKPYKTTPVTVEPLVVHIAISPLEAKRTLSALKCAAVTAQKEGESEVADYYIALVNKVEAQVNRIFASWEYHRRK